MSRPSVEEIRGWVGLVVLDQSGDEVGRCTRAYADDETGMAEWIAVRLREGETSYLVPVADAHRDGESVQVAFSETQIAGSPPLGAPAFVSLEEEDQLYRHYAVPTPAQEESQGDGTSTGRLRSIRMVAGGDDTPATADLSAGAATPREDDTPAVGTPVMAGAGETTGTHGDPLVSSGTLGTPASGTVTFDTATSGTTTSGTTTSDTTTSDTGTSDTGTSDTPASVDTPASAPPVGTAAVNTTAPPSSPPPSTDTAPAQKSKSSLVKRLLPLVGVLGLGGAVFALLRARRARRERELRAQQRKGLGALLPALALAVVGTLISRRRERRQQQGAAAEYRATPVTVGSAPSGAGDATPAPSGVGDAATAQQSMGDAAAAPSPDLSGRRRMIGRVRVIRIRRRDTTGR